MQRVPAAVRRERSSACIPKTSSIEESNPMKTISHILCSLALFPLACDDSNGPNDRTAELPESLLELGWYVDDEGELVREPENGTLERALPEECLVPEETAMRPHSGIDGLTAPADPAAVIYGVWTPLFGTESCQDLFGQWCSASVPNQQCNAGDVCEWYPGASCFDVISSTSVKVLRCKK